MVPRGSKGPTRVELKHLSTYLLEMDSFTGVTVLPGMNCVVLYGKKVKNEGCRFYLFKIGSNKFNGVTNFKSMCNHDDYMMLTPLEISGHEHLAAICWTCNQIALYSLATKEGSVALKDGNIPRVMCAGADNKLYVHTERNDQVLELDCSKPKFFGLIKKFYTKCTCMCYLPFPYNLLAVGDCMSRFIKAFSLDTNQVVWALDQKIDGERPDPWGLLYSERHDALLVADGINKKVLVLDPRNGAHVQTISLPALGDNMGLWFYDNAQTIVMFHLEDFHARISCFSINS